MPSIFFQLAQAAEHPGILEQWQGWIQVMLFVMSVAGAAIWLRRSDRQERHRELAELAHTRGERIEDLEAKVDELRSEVHELRGQVRALTEMKADQIATVVAKKLREEGVVT